MDISNLYEPFEYPPFSVLDTRTSKWSARQKAWRAATGSDSAGRNLIAGKMTDRADWAQERQISEFDPVLAELMVRWFSEEGDLILDPFAGGPTRGLVSGVLGRNYLGYDVYEAQVSANRSAEEKIRQQLHLEGNVVWDIADSAVALPYAPCADMIFTCPPYFNLEQYGTQDNDISNSPDYKTFLHSYADILLKAEERLKKGGFFVVVVSDVREKLYNKNHTTGQYLGLVYDTMDILKFSGLKFYNELVLVNQAGTLPMRAYKPFHKSRKIGRQHQTVLVFYKGDLNTLVR